MQDSKTDEIEEIHLRGFDIIEKMITGITKKSEYSS